MRRLPQHLSIMAVSVMTMSSLAVAPVYAREGSSGGSGSSGSLTTSSTSGGSSSESSVSGSGSSTTSTTTVKADDTQHTSTTSGTSSTLEAENETEAESGSTSGKIKVVTQTGELRAEAAKLLATQRQDQKKTTSIADRQKACDARQAELTTREANYAKNAQKHLDVFNSIYAKVLQYQTNQNVTSADLTTLKSAADAKKAAAVAAIAAISSADTKIDCTSADPAVAVANLKTAVANSRAALQEYRTAIKNLVVALQAVKPVSKTSASTSTDTSTSTTETHTSTNTTGSAQ